MKKNKTALVIFLSILISFIPISPISRVVFSQENPLLEEDYTEITEDFEISGEMEIPEGKTVVVKKGVTITMDNAQVDIEGELIIKGTLNEPVKIKKKDGSYGYFFEVLSGGNFELINADVTGGGTSAFSAEKKSILNTAYAYGPMQGAVDVNGGKFSAQNVNFHDNLIAVSITGSNSTVKVNRSKFLNNFQYEVIRTKTSGTADFRYNWWGNPAGPIKNCEIYIPLEGLIDLDVEKNRLQKEISRLEGLLVGIDKKLSNEKFVSNAVPEVVEKERMKKKDVEANLLKVREIFNNLK